MKFFGFNIFAKKAPDLQKDFVCVNQIQTLLELAQQNAYCFSHGNDENRAYHDICGRNIVNDIITAFENLGVQQIRMLGSGSNAVVIEDQRGLAFRLRAQQTDAPQTQSSPDIDQITLRFYEATVKGARIEGVPKTTSVQDRIQEGSLEISTAKKITQTLRIAVTQQKNPSLFWDWGHENYIKFSQTALLDDDTPIIIDRGSVLLIDGLLNYLSNIQISKKIEEEIIELKKKTIPNIEDLNWDGKWTTEDGTRKTQVLVDQIRKDHPIFQINS